MNDDYALEPELSQPAPRAVARKPKPRVSGCVTVILLPFLLFGVGIFIVGLHSLIVLRGPTVMGVVTDRTSSSDEDGTSYFLIYEYPVDWQTFEGGLSVSRHEYDGTPDGTRAPVKVSPLVPSSGSILLLPGHSVWPIVWVPCAFAVLWNGSLLLSMGAIWGNPRKQKFLVSQGVPVPGRIVEKKIIEGEDSSTCFLRYEYCAHNTTQTLQVRARMAESEAGELHEGQTVTVLHAPHAPKRSLIYRCADYTAL